MIRILFVCHGNICRSPMAEFVMKDLVRKAGRAAEFPEINRPLERREYRRAQARMRKLGFQNGFTQEPDSSGGQYIPSFRLEGVLEKGETHA